MMPTRRRFPLAQGGGVRSQNALAEHPAGVLQRTWENAGMRAGWPLTLWNRCEVVSPPPPPHHWLYLAVGGEAKDVTWTKAVDAGDVYLWHLCALVFIKQDPAGGAVQVFILATAQRP
jgi:hypothetical protein